MGFRPEYGSMEVWKAWMGGSIQIMLILKLDWVYDSSVCSSGVTQKLQTCWRRRICIQTAGLINDYCLSMTSGFVVSIHEKEIISSHQLCFTVLEQRVVQLPTVARRRHIGANRGSLLISSWAYEEERVYSWTSLYRRISEQPSIRKRGSHTRQVVWLQLADWLSSNVEWVIIGVYKSGCLCRLHAESQLRHQRQQRSLWQQQSQSILSMRRGPRPLVSPSSWDTEIKSSNRRLRANKDFIRQNGYRRLDVCKQEHSSWNTELIGSRPWLCSVEREGLMLASKIRDFSLCQYASIPDILQVQLLQRAGKGCSKEFIQTLAGKNFLSWWFLLGKIVHVACLGICKVPCFIDCRLSKM